MSTPKQKSAKAPTRPKTQKQDRTAAAAGPEAMTTLPAKAMSREVAVNAAMASAKATGTRKNSREAMLARIEAVRLEQRQQGHFDCFGRAASGYCDQGGCAHHAECLSVSQLLLAP